MTDTPESILAALGFARARQIGDFFELTYRCSNGAWISATTSDGVDAPRHGDWLVCAYGAHVNNVLWQAFDSNGTVTLEQAITSAMDAARAYVPDSSLAALGFERIHTGGGCHLVALELESGGFVWISSSDGCDVPESDDWLACAYGGDLDLILWQASSGDSELTLIEAAKAAIAKAREYQAPA